jgi:hypothetical protein
LQWDDFADPQLGAFFKQPLPRLRLDESCAEYEGWPWAVVGSHDTLEDKFSLLDFCVANTALSVKKAYHFVASASDSEEVMVLVFRKRDLFARLKCG